MVTVDPKRAVRCRWCGTFESDQWKNSVFRKGLWCSNNCYNAGHFADYLVASTFFVTFSVTVIPSMFLFYITSGNEVGPLSVFILILIIVPFAILSSILTYKSYVLRRKINRFQE
jgi:hypothetical protein